jgi:hypothetical protein
MDLKSSDNKGEGKGKAKEDSSKRSDSPFIIIPPLEEDNDDPSPEWLESMSDLGLGIADDPYPGFEVGLDDDELDGMLGISAAAGIEDGNLSSLLPRDCAKRLVNQIIDAGLESWEFRWMSEAGTNKQFRVGWSRVIPRASRPTSKRRSSRPGESRTHQTTSAGPNNSSSSEEERGRPKEKKGEFLKPLDILLGTVSASQHDSTLGLPSISSGRTSTLSLATKQTLRVWASRKSPISI